MTVLCYHSVRDDWRSPLALHPTAFAQHIAWLARSNRVIDLSDAVSRVMPSGRLAGGAKALTFDDGLSDLYDDAFPILVRYKMTATVFLVAETLTSKGRLVDWINDPPPSSLKTLTLDQILEMQKAGIQFGSHSYAHRDLTQLSDEECQRDLESSRQLLENVLGTRVAYLAYPGGHHSERVRESAARAGFTHAFGTLRGRDAVGPHAIPRVGVYAGDKIHHLRIKSMAGYIPFRRSRIYEAFRGLTSRVRRPSP
jgi:peptidoglycan/xylan/chitin deacetylase (PgdA/CDA1 family)